MEAILIQLLGLFGDGPLAWLAMAAAGGLAVVFGRRRRAVARSRQPEALEAAPKAGAASRTEPQSAPASEPAAAPQSVPSPERAQPAAPAEPIAPAAPESEPTPAPERETESAPEPEPAPQSAAAPSPVAAAPSVLATPPVLATTPAPAPPPRARLRDRLRRTSDALTGRLAGIFGAGRALDPALLDELEEILMTADLGVATAESLLEQVRREGRGVDGAGLRALLKQAIAAKLARAQQSGDAFALVGKPHVILVLGVNGAGKTTTIGKLAAQHRARGRSVLLGAGDTFRAAAIEQLQIWGTRVGCEVIAGEAGGDPASVAFDTVKAAVGRGADVAIIDTAGRLQTKKPLMEELAKIVRVIGRDVPGAPHEILLVLDANTGQNAISQAKLFTEVARVTGLVLTKLDGTAKGGVIVGLADQFGIPVQFVGVGEAVDDLRTFDAREFADALFDEGD